MWSAIFGVLTSFESWMGPGFAQVIVVSKHIFHPSAFSGLSDVGLLESHGQTLIWWNLKGSGLLQGSCTSLVTAVSMGETGELLQFLSWQHLRLKHSDQTSTLLEVSSWQKMDWGILHKDLNAISVPGFSTLQHQWLNIGDASPVAWNKNLDALYPGGLQIYLLYSKSIAGIKYLHISTWPTLKNNYYLM